MERLERNDQLRGRTVRVGDDAALAETHNGVGIDFGYDQRDVRVIAPERRIIDDDGAGGCDLWAPFLGDGRTSRHQADVDVGKIEMVEHFALENPVAERNLRA